MLNSALGILKQYQDSKQIGLFLFPSLFNRAYALPKVDLFYSQNGRSHSLIKHEENIVICTRSFTKRSAMLPFCETFHFSHLALSHFVKAFFWELSQNGTLPHYLFIIRMRALRCSTSTRFRKREFRDSARALRASQLGLFGVSLPSNARETKGLNLRL